MCGGLFDLLIFLTLRFVELYLVLDRHYSAELGLYFGVFLFRPTHMCDVWVAVSGLSTTFSQTNRPIGLGL